MKKRIVCMLLALLLLVGMLPVGVFAEGKTEYEKNETGTAVFNSVLSGQPAYITDDPTLGLNASGDYNITVDEALLSQTFYIADSYVGESEYWYKLEPLDGETMPEKLSAKPWVYQNDIPTGGNVDALIITPPANTCRCCESCTGAEDCACGCGECQFCEPTETDPTTPSTPENPCKCCENCTGAEDCECGCENCQFYEPEEPEYPTLTDPETNVAVTLETLPEGVDLEVDPDADVSAQFSDFGIPAANQVFGLDITLTQGGTEYQPGGAYIKVPVDETIPVGTMIGIIHKHGNEVATFTGLTKVLSDHTVEFYTDSFSEFAGFTVDFHYNGSTYSIEGYDSILLSELFEIFEIPEDATQATSVVFSNNDLVQVTDLGGDWLLTSLAAFDTEETLIIAFSDHTIVIDVTDEQYMGQPGTYHIYRLFGDRSDFYIEYNSASKAGGSAHINFYYYNWDETTEQDDDTGTHYWAWTTNNDLAQATTFYNKSGVSLWYDIYKTNHVYMNEENRMSYQMGYTSILGEGDLYFRSHSTAITWTQASGATINPNNLCTISVEPRVGSGVDTRHIEVYYNGKKAGEARNVLFPRKNDTADGYDERNALVVSQSNTSRYAIQTHVVNFSGDGNQTLSYTYDYNTSTYRIDFYDYAYQLNYNVNQGVGSIDSTVISANSASSYDVPVTSSEPTRAGYKFLGWADSASATTAKYTAGGTVPITGTQSSNGSTITAEKTVYAVWQEIPDVTIHHYLQGTTTKVANDTVVALPYGQSVTVANYKQNITNYEYVSCSPTSFIVGATEAGNTATIYYKNVTKYTVTYEYTSTVPNGAPAVPNEADVNVGSEVEVADAPSLTGYNFNGWTTADVTVTDGKFTMPATDVTFTGSWTLIDYTIEYELNGGKNNPLNPASYNVESLDITLEDPTPPDGYTFGGWAEGNSIPAGSTGDKYFTAQWEAETYTITYNHNDKDTNPTTSTVSYDIEDEFTLNDAPTREGYKFSKWNLADGLTAPNGNWAAGDYDASQQIAKGKYGNITLVAQWEEQYRYVLNFNANGGNGAPDSITEEWCGDKEHTFTWTEVPTRTGYTFMGWAEEAASEENVAGADKNSIKLDGEAAETVTKTIFAIWKRDTGTIQLNYSGDVPVVVTVTCTDAVNDSEKITINTVITSNTTIKDLPTGTYKVTAESGNANYTAYVNPGSTLLKSGETANFDLSVSDEGFNWLTGFAHVINKRGG